MCKSERTRGRLRAGPFRIDCDSPVSRCPGLGREYSHVPDLRLVTKAAVGAPPWFRATALGTCWLGAWATTPGKFVKKVSANVPLLSPAKAEPTPSATTAAAASIMVFIVILLGLLPLSRRSSEPIASG